MLYSCVHKYMQKYIYLAFVGSNLWANLQLLTIAAYLFQFRGIKMCFSSFHHRLSWLNVALYVQIWGSLKALLYVFLHCLSLINLFLLSQFSAVRFSCRNSFFPQSLFCKWFVSMMVFIWPCADPKTSGVSCFEGRKNYICKSTAANLSLREEESVVLSMWRVNVRVEALPSYTEERKKKTADEASLFPRLTYSSTHSLT